MRVQLGLALMLAACGGTTGDAMPDGATPTDGGANVDSAGARDLAAAPAAPLFPLALGHQWTYASTLLGSGAACGTTMTQSVSSANAADGRAAFQVTTLCPPPTLLTTDSYSVPTPGGDEVDYDDQGTWFTVVDPMLVDGHSWPWVQGLTLTWERVTGSVIVPAGTFDDCWTAHSSQTGNVFTTYCRGVGVVRTHFDQSGNGAEWQLTAKNF